MIWSVFGQTVRCCRQTHYSLTAFKQKICSEHLFDTIEHMCYSVNDETAHIVCSSIYNTHCLLDEQMHCIMRNMRSRLFDRTNTGIGGIFMAKGKISAKQEEILEYIKAQTLQRGYPPAVREICDAVHLKSTSSVHSHLETLEKNGYIRRDPTKPRAIEIIDDEFNLARREIVNVPVIGEIAAGEPIFAEQNIEGYFPLLPEDVPTGESFMLKVRGESMINVGIYDGDKILVKKQNTARNGEIVVALVEDSATIKTFYKEDGHYRLQPENDTMDPIIVDRVEILGKLAGLYRTYR